MRDALDPPRTSPSPPPAPAGHPWRDRALIVVFVLLLPVMAVVDPLRGAAIRWEQRRAADWPPASALASPAKFAAAFDRAFADRFGMRSALIVAQHWALVAGFGVSPVGNVLLGRDGWLFWLGEDGRSLDRHFRCVTPVADAELAAFVAEVRRRHAYLRARGIAYLVVIVPEKITVYPEQLPPWASPGRATPLARTIELLAADGGVPYVDLRGPLREAKARDRLYYQTDSHWNLAGAAVGYLEIMRVLQKLLPGRLATIVPPVRPPYAPGRDLFQGDLACAIGVPFLFHEPDLVPAVKVMQDPAGQGLLARRVHDFDGRVEIYELEKRLDLPRLVVNCDSMTMALIPMLSENFQRSVYRSSHELDRQVLDAERPDVVIEEMVERGITSLSSFPFK